MFNSHSGFKAATTAAFNAVKTNSRTSLTQFREVLAQHTPFGSVAAYKASFDNNVDTQPITSQKEPTRLVVIATSIRNEEVYSTAHNSKQEAFDHIIGHMLEDIEQLNCAQGFIEYFLSQYVSDPDLEMDIIEEYLKGLDEEGLKRCFAFVYSGDNPILTFSFTHLAALTEQAINQSENDNIIDEFFSMPDAVIAQQISLLGWHELMYSPQIGITAKDGSPISHDDLNELVHFEAKDIDSDKLKQLLSIKECYVMDVTNIIYDCDDNEEVDAPTEITFIHNEALEADSAYEELIEMIDDMISNKTGYCFSNASISFFKCCGNRVINIQE